MMRALVTATLALLLAAGCVPYTTRGTEVGIRVNKITGVEDTIYPPGATVFFMPFITEWHTLPTDTQSLEMRDEGAGKDRGDVDDVEFKTRDGNDVAVDVTVLYRIDQTKAAFILQNVASSAEDLKDVVIRPLARSIPRDALNALTSEDIYTEKKFAAAEESRKELNRLLNPMGVIVENVTLHDHRFHADYQRAINDKKVFDQQVNTNRSACDSAVREWEANLEKTKGDVDQAIAAEQGKLAQAKLEADAYYYSKQKEAEAILAEREAKAKGIRKLREAMNGTGGRTRIKMRLVEALKGKRFVVVPSGGASGLSITKLNINDLMRQTAAQEAQ